MPLQIQLKFVLGVTTAYTVLLLLLIPPSKEVDGDVSPLRRGIASTRRGSYAYSTNAFDNDRQAKVVEMTRHSWRGYMAAAAGKDELKPISNTSNNKWGGAAITAVDALDTLILTGLLNEYEEAKEIVLRSKHESQYKGSIFETTIRHVGGALSAYALTGEKAFLDKAKRTTDSMMGGFNPKTGLSYHQVQFGTSNRENEGWCNHKTIIAEAGTLHMEFGYLSTATKDGRYAKQSMKLYDHLAELLANGWPKNESHYDEGAPEMPHPGLWPSFIDPESGKFSGAASFASLSDSFYEYLLKAWILFGKKDDVLLELYENSVEALLNNLIKYTPKTHMAYVGHTGIGFEPTFDHLSCFVPGMLTLGVMHGAHEPKNGKARERDWGNDEVIGAAVDLAATCYRLYKESPTGIGPEVVRFEKDGSYTVTNAKYILRPEAVESLFYLYRYTGDEKYRDWGWDMLLAVDKHCRTPSAFSAIAKVNVKHDSQIEFQDSMESFWFAETLKYFYLLFSPADVLPLDKFVLTTEGHPLPIQ